MSDIIKLLPDSVANQIAAGEVIQRPASVVKELMENAIDAGAGHIKVNIKDAGRTLVQVIDDGCGMSPIDAKNAFERHSTSKINQASDLFAIRTLGFRGEALASIAAVAQVSLKTRRHEDEVGTEIVIHGSKLESQESASCPPGSNFMVRNLFFNVPARRKFLKTNATEFRHIIHEFYRVALTRPELEFSLVHNGSEIYSLPASQQKMRILNLLGKSMNQVLIPLHTETKIVRIYGFIGRPEAAKKTAGEQFFFVNRRFMRHPYLHKAVMEAYGNVLPPDTIPGYFLYLEVATDSIDINIHPTKTEIKFEDERSIYQIIYASVREALGKHSMIPSLDFDAEGAVEIPLLTKDTDIKMPGIDINPEFNPFEADKAAEVSNGPFSDRERGSVWASLYEDLSKAKSSLSESLDVSREQQPEYAASNIFQFKKKYILLAIKSGMVIVDQKRAHERILFEKYLGTVAREKAPAQQELYPVIIELNAAYHAQLIEIFNDICSLGFDIRDLGDQRIEVKGMPADIQVTNPQEWLESFLSDYMENEGDIRAEPTARLAASMARTSAVGYGRTFQPEEMQELLDQLFACREPGITADGKAVFRILPTEDLDRMFN
jgi:DNA mismatch repair protein MutL